MWGTLIDEIRAKAEISDQGVADLIAAQSKQAVVTSYMTISRLRRGEAENPPYDLGAEIMKLHRRLCGKKAANA